MPLPLPPSLSKLKHYLKRASELESHDPIVSYFCRCYALQMAIPLMSSDPSSIRPWVMNMMEELEVEKGNLESAVDLGQERVTDMAIRVFKKADDVDRQGQASMRTAQEYFASSCFFDVLKYFYENAEIPSDLDKMRLYSKFKAADIIKALKAGERPRAGPPGEEDDGLSGEFGNFSNADFSSVYAHQLQNIPAGPTQAPRESASSNVPPKLPPPASANPPAKIAPPAAPTNAPAAVQCVQIGVQKILTMMAPDGMTTYDLKSDIAARAGIDKSRYDLRLNNRSLINALSLASCGMQNGTTLVYVSDVGVNEVLNCGTLPVGEMLTLFIAIGSPMVISVTPDMSSSIEYVMTEVQRQSGIRPSEQSLTYQGVELVPELCLSDFEIPVGAVLCLMWDPPVGLPPKSPFGRPAGGGSGGSGDIPISDPYAAHTSTSTSNRIISPPANRYDVPGPEPAAVAPAPAAAANPPVAASLSRPPAFDHSGNVPESSSAPSKPVVASGRPRSPVERPTRSPTAGISADTQKVFDAQKYCKFAQSALQFKDVPTAIVNLKLALSTLTSEQY